MSVSMKWKHRCAAKDHAVQGKEASTNGLVAQPLRNHSMNIHLTQPSGLSQEKATSHTTMNPVHTSEP